MFLWYHSDDDRLNFGARAWIEKVTATHTHTNATLFVTHTELQLRIARHAVLLTFAVQWGDCGALEQVGS
jgi:hypothetical protein